MKPEKLKIGDEIRVIAPSRSMCILNGKGWKRGRQAVLKLFQKLFRFNSLLLAFLENL